MKYRLFILGAIAVIAIAGATYVFTMGRVQKPAEQVGQTAQPTPATQTSIANPASEFCVANGGRLNTHDTPEGQATDCAFTKQSCDEWALFRGECNIEGVSNAASYKSGTTTVAVIYRIHQKTAVLKAPALGYDWQPLNLAMSGSGARYISEDQKIEVWEHQETLRVSVDGKEIFSGKLVPSVPQK